MSADDKILQHEVQETKTQKPLSSCRSGAWLQRSNAKPEGKQSRKQEVNTSQALVILNKGFDALELLIVFSFLLEL